MAMNENESKTTVLAGTPKHSGRYPWVEDDGLKALSEMDTTLIDLDDQLRGVLEDIQYYFGHYGSGEDKGIIGDLDHAIELLIPRLGYQKALIRSQYNKKATQLNELAIAYAQICEEKTKLDEDCKRHVDDCCNTAQLCTKLQTELKNEQNRAESDRAYLKKRITELHQINSKFHDECNDLQKELNTAKGELEDTRDNLVVARNMYLRECDKTKKLAEQVDARDNLIADLTADLEDWKERTAELEEELEYEQDDTRYERGYRHGSEELYEALKIMIDMIRRDDDFYKVFDIDESANDDDIVKLFDQMSAEEFLNACRNYRNQIIREIKVGDEIVDLAHGDHMIVIEVNDDSYKCVVRLAQPPVHRPKKICSKTGRHYLHVPFDYDGRERG